MTGWPIEHKSDLLTARSIASMLGDSRLEKAWHLPYQGPAFQMLDDPSQPLKIHGIRIYPQSVEIVPGEGAPIYVHGSVSEDCSDFFYTFRPLASSWCGHLFAKDSALRVSSDNLPRLRKIFGSSLVAADIKTQLLVLKGDDFEQWGSSMDFCEGAFLPVFREQPSFDLLNDLFWSRDFKLTSETWPAGMRAVLHLWDDIYWQLFTTGRSDIETLLQAHAGDPKLKMYFVDLDREYPDPSNQELQPATLPGES
jgi:hypothetical protein